MADRRSGQMQLLDVHGAGSQRSDPKTGDASAFPQGHGPQGDVVRIENLVRLVRGGTAVLLDEGPEIGADQQVVQRGPGRQRMAPEQQGIGRQPGLGQPGRGGRAPQSFLERLDKDGDGRVSRSEFDGPPDRFPGLDKDGDGFISGDEIPSRPPPRAGRP